MQGFSFHLTLQDLKLSGSSFFVYFFFQLSYELHSKSNCFATLELHFVDLIVTILHCDCPHRFDVVLFLRSNWNGMFCSFFFIFFVYMKMICQTLWRNSDYKIEITAKKSSNPRISPIVSNFLDIVANLYRLSNFLVT